MALKKAVKQAAFGKIGLFGFAGTGKTYSSSNFAIGLHKFIDSKGPVAMFDTETGSDFLVEKFEKAGVEFLTEKSRSFRDLMKFLDDAEKARCEIVIIDSITHVWMELQNSYKADKNRTRLTFADWGILKEQWGKFVDRFIVSKMHIFLCGRAKYEYEHFEDEDGKKETTKVGTTMKAEVDFSYEPSLLLELKRIRPTDDRYIAERGIEKMIEKRSKVNTKWVHVAEVNKDRTDTINGATLVYPTFDDIKPHFANLNIGGAHTPLDIGSTSAGMFKTEYEGPDGRTQAIIALEEIEAEVVTICGAGQSKVEKQSKIDLIRKIFGTGSWTQVTTLSLESLRNGLTILRQMRVDKQQAEQIAAAPEAPAEAPQGEQQNITQ